MRPLLTGRRTRTVLIGVMALSAVLAVPAIAAADAPPFVVLNAALYAPSPQSEAHFGTSVAVSGDTVVVGEPDRDVFVPFAAGTDSGATYVYVKSGAGWVFQQVLMPPFQSDTQYGSSVAIDGDVLVVGSPGYATASGKTGAAFVYRRTGTTWTLEKHLPGSVANGNHGAAVAIDGTTIAVGASGDGNGKVRPYLWTGTDWVQQGTLIDPSGSSNDQLGGSVAVEGDWIVAGAAGDDTGSVAPIADVGSAHWFTRSGAVWAHQQTFFAPDPSAGASFGGPISLSGSRVLVGAWQAAVGAVPGAGAAYAFVNGGTSWMNERKFTAPAPTAHEYFGSSVALDGETALIGAFFADSYHGNAYLYTYGAGSWTERQRLDGGDYTPVAHQLGTSAALAGGTAVLGAQMASSPGPGLTGAGGAFVFTPHGLAGVVRDAGTGLPVAGIEVSAYVPDSYGEPDLVALTNTDSFGRYSLPLDAGDYRIGWMDGTSAYYPGFYNEVQLWSQSSTVTVAPGAVSALDVSVHPKPQVYLTKTVAPSSVRRYRRFTAYGYLKPRHPRGSRPVILECYLYQRQRDGGYEWVLVKTTSARAYDYRPNRRRAWYTKYRTTLSLPARGKWRIRAYHPADATYGPTYTDYRYITVR
jgi:hypothetical protein